jgi:hypothetical protein
VRTRVRPSRRGLQRRGKFGETLRQALQRGRGSLGLRRDFGIIRRILFLKIRPRIVPGLGIGKGPEISWNGARAPGRQSISVTLSGLEDGVNTSTCSTALPFVAPRQALFEFYLTRTGWKAVRRLEARACARLSVFLDIFGL